MIAIYKDLKIWYYIVSSGIGVILAFVLISIGVRTIPAILIIFLWVILWSLIFSKLAMNRTNSIARFREDCNIRTFLEKYSALLPNQKNGSMSDSLVKLNLAAGYIDKGDMRNAFNLMSKIQVPPSRIKGSAALAATYHSNYSLAFIKEGNIGKAREALAACRKVLAESNVPDRERPRYEWYCQLRQAQIDIISCNESAIGRAEEAFKTYVNNATTLLERVSGNYWLARIAYMKSDREAEKKYLQFAASNGGDTIYAEEARRILEMYKNESL